MEGQQGILRTENGSEGKKERQGHPRLRGGKGTITGKQEDNPNIGNGKLDLEKARKIVALYDSLPDAIWFVSGNYLEDDINESNIDDGWKKEIIANLKEGAK